MKQTLLLLVVTIISVCSAAQTRKSTTTSTSVRVSVKTTTTPKHTLSATHQAFFDELHMLEQEFVDNLAEERAYKARKATIQPAIDKVNEMLLMKQLTNPPATLPVTMYDVPVIETPVVYVDRVIVMPVVVRQQARNSTSTTSYTDRNGHSKTVTTTTRRY